MLKTILGAAANGEEISLPGFGKFKVKETPEREGRNPTSGEAPPRSRDQGPVSDPRPVPGEP
jgi:nucleoid DNA-binding protein